MWILAALLVTAFAAKPTTVEEFLAEPVEEHVEQLSEQAFVDYINEHQSFYRAEYSPEADAFVRARIMSPKLLGKPTKGKVWTPIRDEEPPESFDARTQWPECKSIRTVRDQSHCGSCWAVASASAMSDELCVQSNSAINVIVSDTDILSCSGSGGCGGGWPVFAFLWMRNHGVVTGGKYRQKNVCKPYAFYPCGPHKDESFYGPCPKDSWPTPKCRKRCQHKYKKSYEEDKYFAKEAYSLSDDEKLIRQWIYEHGPVVATFTVYKDFKNYKEGIYVHKYGDNMGLHAVKIIGWGRENGTDYWLIANSWNTDFGENGYFRILRGKNHCGIENQIDTAIMKV